MSRIGNRVLTIPQGVNVTINNNDVVIKGPKGELSYKLFKGMSIKQEGNNLIIERSNNMKLDKQKHGAVNAHIANMLKGVSEGFKIDLEMVGVGYRFQQKGNQLIINVGFSHPVVIDIPQEIKVDLISNTEATIFGIDKDALGEIAARIRKIKKPEPYKGKGIRYKDEYVRRKVGKKAI